MMVDGCEHNWVYENAVLCSYPPQRRRICTKCGEKETITCGVVTPFKDTYKGTMERFALHAEGVA